MTVVDASIVVRLLQSRRGDDALRAWFRDHGHLDAPALVDAEVTSAIRGLLLTAKPTVTISEARAEQMLDDLADLPLVRWPLQPYQRRVISLRNNFTASDAFYVALAESLGVTLLTEDRKFAKAAGHVAEIASWA